MQVCTNFYKMLSVWGFLTFITTTLSAQNRLQQFDDRIMIDLAEHRTREKTGYVRFISDTYRYGDVAVPAGLLVAGVISKDRNMRENAAFIASSTAISYGLTLLIKHIVRRPRPFENIKIVPVYRAASSSFPSGHTSTTFSTATALSMAYPKWYVIVPAYLWAGSVGYSRMYLGVHYPTDVGAGALLGVGSALSMSFMRAR
ncbi:phosphatase PAP2 family protein [Mucilaginibacter antarcticus]|uniref:Phosphatase PAP2 family protein n=1 Tax=Mucilaginibacter antarcticus TaxID=1855725 RepID=A0ABW5XSG3_9SPHI